VQTALGVCTVILLPVAVRGCSCSDTTQGQGWPKPQQEENLRCSGPGAGWGAVRSGSEARLQGAGRLRGKGAEGLLSEGRASGAEPAGRAASAAVPGCAGCWHRPSPALGLGPSRQASGERLSRNRRRTCARPPDLLALLPPRDRGEPGPRARAARRGGARGRGGRQTNTQGKIGAVSHREPQSPRTASAPGGASGTGQHGVLPSRGALGSGQNPEGSGCGAASSSPGGRWGTSGRLALKPRQFHPQVLQLKFCC